MYYIYLEKYDIIQEIQRKRVKIFFILIYLLNKIEIKIMKKLTNKIIKLQLLIH